MNKDFAIWEGVYDSFNAISIVGDGFEGDTWITNSVKEIKNELRLAQKNKLIVHDLPFYSLAANLYTKNQKIRVLDFGGGMGKSFVHLFSVLPQNKSIDYTVIESKKVTVTANKIFAKDSRITFLSKLPKHKKFDIIYISSSLQYIEEWQELLLKLSRYKAKYFIFTDLPAGNIKKTYVTSQNYYDSKIACLFFKLDDIISELNKINYTLIYKNNFQANILKRYNYYPQYNFDKKYQINYSKTLVFKNKI